MKCLRQERLLGRYVRVNKSSTTRFLYQPRDPASNSRYRHEFLVDTSGKSFPHHCIVKNILKYGQIKRRIQQPSSNHRNTISLLLSAGRTTNFIRPLQYLSTSAAASACSS